MKKLKAKIHRYICILVSCSFLSTKSHSITITEHHFLADHESWTEALTKDYSCVLITVKDAARLRYCADNIYFIDIIHEVNDILLNIIDHAFNKLKMDQEF